MLKKHDREIKKVDQLVIREEKIDCYHTIFERKHKAMEEYHWSLLDDKHSLIAEYLKGMNYKKSRNQFETLYGEVIADYRQIIAGNKVILAETKKIIPEKEKRIILLKEAVRIMKSLVRQMPCVEKPGNAADSGVN